MAGPPDSLAAHRARSRAPRHDPVPRRKVQPLPPGALKPFQPVQVTRSVRILRGLSVVLFAIALVCAFAAGAWELARGLEAVGWLDVYPAAVLGYAAAFGLVCRRLRL